MYYSKIIFLNDLRQALQIVDILRVQLPGCPAAGDSGIRVKLRETKLAYGCPIMISSNTNMVILAQKLKALVGVWTIADNISQAPHLLYLSAALDVFQHGSKSGQVSMNISNNGVTHSVKNIAVFSCCG